MFYDKSSAVSKLLTSACLALCMATFYRSTYAQQGTPIQEESVRLYHDAKPYIDLPVSEIRSKVASLRDLKVDENQQPGPILEQTMQIVEHLLDRMPKLAAEEQISEGRHLESYPETTMVTPSRDGRFEYIMGSTITPGVGVVLNESRNPVGKKAGHFQARHQVLLDCGRSSFLKSSKSKDSATLARRRSTASIPTSSSLRRSPNECSTQASL